MTWRKTYDELATAVEGMNDGELVSYAGGVPVSVDSGKPFEGIKLFSSGAVTTYSTIAAALAAAISGDIVYVGPGTYTESITIPDGVRILGFPAAQQVVIAGADTTSTRVTFAGTGTLREVTVVGPSSGSNPAIDASGIGAGELAVVFNSVIQGGGGTNTGPGLKGAGSGILVALQGLYHNGGTIGGAFVEITGGTALLQELIGNVGACDSFIKQTGGTVSARDWSLQDSSLYSCTDGIEVGGGTFDIIGLQGDFSAPAVENGVHVTADGVTVRLTGAELYGQTYDWLVDPALTGAGTKIRILSSQFRYERLNFPSAFAAGADITAVFEDEAEQNNPTSRIIGELSVGIAEIPRESAFGEGDSNVNGMHVFAFDGSATWADNTTAAKSSSGSTFTLLNAVTSGAIAYFGCETRKFYGLKIDSTLAGSKGGGDGVWEYWNGSAWTAFSTMTSDAESPFTSYADQTWFRLNGEQIRFDTAIGAAWVTTTVNSQNAFWVRWRVTSAVTTSPTLERVKLHTNRTEINKQGFIEFFGTSQPLATLNFSLADLIPVAGATPRDDDIAYSTNITLQATNNRFQNGATDGTGGEFAVPDDMDTSRPFKLHIYAYPKTTGGDYELELTYAFHTTTTVLDGTASDTTVTNIITAGTAFVVQEWEVEIDASSLLPGETLPFKIIRDATGGNPDDTLGGDVVIESIFIEYTKWRT